MSFTVTSELQVGADELLATLNMAGVNEEIAPFLKMTAPAGWATRPIEAWPERTSLFSSWILLFGIVPLDKHTFFFRSIDPASGFSESSSSLMHSCWEHQREIDGSEFACRISDTVNFKCRVPGLAVLLAPIYRAVFRHRHRRLRMRYGYNHD
ncbi:hypothetical protein [Allohahella marinimesophila]|uniref:Ligand-binding SRPBCC domain-containing protein n=1 Tax=Allohahella marinimesophila TaxID=1054972 RepID=A0ABP7PI97_9GAMM